MSDPIEPRPASYFRMPHSRITAAIVILASSALLGGAFGEVVVDRSVDNLKKLPAKPIAVDTVERNENVDKVDKQLGKGDKDRLGAQPVAATPAAPSAAPPTRYSMRCWQYGRLLFDESLSQLPPDTASITLRLQGADRAQSTYQLVDTRTAVCLVKPAADRTPWPNGGAVAGSVMPGR